MMLYENIYVPYVFRYNFLTPIPSKRVLYRSEGITLTGYFFPTHGDWGKDNSEEFFLERHRRCHRLPPAGGRRQAAEPQAANTPNSPVPHIFPDTLHPASADRSEGICIKICVFNERHPLFGICFKVYA